MPELRSGFLFLTFEEGNSCSHDVEFQTLRKSWQNCLSLNFHMCVIGFCWKELPVMIMLNCSLGSLKVWRVLRLLCSTCLNVQEGRVQDGGSRGRIQSPWLNPLMQDIFRTREGIPLAPNWILHFFSWDTNWDNILRNTFFKKNYLRSTFHAEVRKEW